MKGGLAADQAKDMDIVEDMGTIPPSPRSGVALPRSKTWVKGQSGNPKGRPPNAGQSIIERINDIHAKGLTCEEIATLAENPRVGPTDRAAARRIIAQWHDDEQLSREGFKVVADYTNGKPRQDVKVEQVDTRSSEERAVALLAEMRRMIGADTDV